MVLTWHDASFDALTTADLHAILALRCAVFVVEQACPYLDVDGLDPVARHVWATDQDGRLVAYLRVLPPGAKFAEATIGRVAIAPAARGAGLGYELMRHGLAAIGPQPAALSAQAHLTQFYAALGFAAIGPAYDDDGIPHVDMRRA